jgi:carbonic anhydrase/acetyltransferase-like protein (isoleucine patch superfamily)
MPLYEFEGKAPSVHPSAFVAPTASIIGDVTIEQNASVWYGVVLRADFGPIVVRAGANVQDGSVLHTPEHLTCEIGEGATIGHSCMVHGATIGTEALIGNGAIVLDGATIGERTLVAAGSVVTGDLPSGVLALGAPARVKGPLEGTNGELWVAANPQVYRDLAQRHRTGIREV